jgi:glycosyltransferase involved in cell wall biosynthesis
MPEISVIIPSYQHADTLPACLDSVFKQTFKDIEVIVINDGSTDDTDEAVKPYLDKIIYKKSANGGAQKARNAGFDLSRGHYVIFCDADITMKPTMLAKLHDALENDQSASYAYGGFRFGLAHFRAEKFDADRLRRVNYIHTSSLIRRGVFPRFDEELKRFHDWDLWLTMLEHGKTGIAVMETLFRAKPRRGMKYAISQWLPKIFYSRIFDALGIRLKAVARYREAAEVIRRKHNLPAYAFAPENGPSWAWFLAVFAVSALSFGHNWVGTVISLLYLFITLKTALRSLIYGVGFELAELIFGSLAGKTLAISLFGFVLPLRIALFAAVGLVWLVRILQKRVRRPPPAIVAGVIAVLLAVGWGIVNGLMHGIPFHDVFSDANAYFALPIVLIFFSAVQNENDQALLKKILKNGAIALSIVTIAALYFFGHHFWNPAGVFAYKWLRDTRIAEVTALAGGIYRVFIQSQIFCLLAFFMAVFSAPTATPMKIVGRHEFLKNYAWVALPAAALIISGSRSFALGIVAAIIIWIILTAIPNVRDREWLGGLKKIVILLIYGATIYGVFLFFPIPTPRSQTSFQDMLRSRQVSERDVATASRWSLLAQLDEKILEAPVFGSGFGTIVTYQSSDPRIIASTGGSYTTDAFEWNYHDIMIKMGLFGLLAYGYLLYAIYGILRKSEPRQRRWLLPAFFALLVLNAVSPFLNHPLGIGYLALLLALAETKKGEPVTVAEVVRSPAPAVAAVPAGMAMMNEE